MWKLKDLVAIGVVLLFFGVAAQPAIAQPKWNTDSGKSEARGREVPAPFKELAGLVAKLKEASTDPTDTDHDGLVDSIELVIGTDPGNPDSDFDQLNDSAEVSYGLDPQKPDSNGDRLPDYFEVANVSADLDGDGTPNGWDWDNDDDGVMDGLDLSPNAKTATSSSFGIHLVTGGKPTYVNFQLRAKNPEHLKQYSRIWNWPYDDKGQMQDLDNSVDDVTMAPILELEADVLPDKDSVASHGIIIGEHSANIPLLPVLDLGTVVGFEGRMVFPASGTPLDISTTLKMSWRVFGQNDKPVKSLQAQNGKLVSANQMGVVRANASSFSPNITYEVVETGKNNEKSSFKAVNGCYLAVGKDNLLDATGTQINSTTEFTREDKGSGKIALKSGLNGLYVSLRADGRLAAESKTVTEREKFVLGAAGFRSENIPLVIYPEEFLLTGMSVEENYGDDLGQFYGDNVTTLVAANLMLSYDFLRNATTKVSDMPGMVRAEGMVLQNRTMAVATRDDLTAELGGKPVYDLVRSLPEHSNLPVISIFEDRTATLEMSEMASGSFILGTNLTANVSHKPVISVKTLKTNWYDTDNDTLLDPAGTVSALKGLGLEEDALTMLTGLMMVWNNGESIVVKVGPTYADLNPPEVKKVTDWVLDIQKYGLNITMNTILTVFKVVMTAYTFMNIAKIPELLKCALITSKISRLAECWNYVSESMGKISSALKAIGNVLNIVGCAIAVILAGVTAWVTMKAYGYSEYGIAVAISNFVFTAAYAIVMCILCCMCCIGPVIAGIIAVLDFLCFLIWKKSWIAEGIAWLANQFVKRSERTTPGLDPISTSLNLQDKQTNGLDQGDRLTYIARLYGNITKTSKGSWGDVTNSYIQPTLYYVDGAGQKVNNARSVESEQIIGNKKVTVYNASAWAEPASPTVNYPFTTVLSYTYHTYYQVRYVFVYTKTYSETKSKDLDPNTMYLDVMPNSFEGLAGWKALTSRDSDGDGINNTAETRSDPQLYDTDSDGLNDKFELDAGTDPRKSDTDGDGLGDLQEMRLGIDPCWSDSDGDGLSDSVECTGWVVNFNYSGVEFSWHIASDPTLNDTDCDGLDDPTERSRGFNPMSADTDGNGVHDMYDNTVHKLAYSYSLQGPPGQWMTVRPMAVERDAEGYMYVLFELRGMAPGTSYQIMKYYPSGNPLASVVDADNGARIYDFVLDSSGNICAYGTRILPGNDDGVVVYNSDGSMFRYLHFDYPAWSAWKSIAVDDKNDFLYSANYYNGTITRYNLTTGAMLKTWEPGASANRYNGRMTFDSEGYLYCADWELGVVYKLDSNLGLVRKFNESESGRALSAPKDEDIAPNGDMVILENHGHRVVMLDRTGHFYTSFGSFGTGDDNFYYPASVAWADDKVLVADSDRVKVLSHTVTHNPPRVVSFTDADGDGLTDARENAGWNVTVKNAAGTLKYKVTSDTLLPDTDGDRLPDLEESIAGTDPRSPDTDGDGLSDYDEYKPGGRAGTGSSPTDADSDGDGLGDGVESTFGSDPAVRDTDGDGLADEQEFLQGADPGSNDTDWDGLNDSEEVLFGSSPLRPDTDEDLMADGLEYRTGADPNSADTDGDGLTDGYEVVYGTNATDPDTDGDGLSDSIEMEKFLDPLSGDTDGDGVSDSLELERGTDPLYNDTDDDGIPDSLDTDYELALDGEIWLVADPDSASAEFSAELSKRARVFEITPRELLSLHKSERNIVLVGRPDAENGTAGALIGELLADSGEVLDGMLSGADESAVRYGCWSPDQTVVMLARARATEPDMVLGILKSMRMTVTDSSVTAKFLDTRDSFALDDLTTVGTTGAAVWAQLESKTTFNLSVSSYDKNTAPATLTHSNGLEPGEVAMGRYLGIRSSDNLQGPGYDIITELQLQVLFTARDLDRTGDGDFDDPADLDALSLSLFWYDESSGNWTRLAESQDWVDGLGVSTTNLTLYGKEYAGYLWANVTHLSLFGIAGRPVQALPLVARAGDDLTLHAEEVLVLNGSLSSGDGPIINYTWTMQYGAGPILQYGPRFSFVPSLPGTYLATLTVMDSLGRTASDTVSVTVIDRPDGRWTLLAGPVRDEAGKPLGEALVRITAGSETVANNTGADGFALMMAKVEHIGSNVTVYIEKAGYLPVEYRTRITSDRKLETSPPALVRINPWDTGILTIGPVRDVNGNVIKGAEVTVKINNTEYSGTTDSLGMARIVIPLAGIGKTAGITVRARGFKEVSYESRISPAMTPDTAPPAARPVAAAPSGQAGTTEGTAAMVALLAVLVLVALLLVWRKPPARGKGQNGDEE